MISADSLTAIAHIFCGDIEGYYSYKSGPKLVSFFNDWLRADDEYGQGFPSRWVYAYDKIAEIINNNSFDRFLGHILNKQFIIQDLNCTEVEAAEKSEAILAEFNRVLGRDQYLITHNGDEYHLVQQNLDLVLIGSGGFANVYYQKSTGHVVKKLKEDFVTDKGIRSRFKREYEITKSLQDMHGIIKVFAFDEGKCAYSMERAEQTLEKYISGKEITDDIRLNCIRQILFIMTGVHKRDIIHRDLSPNNTFVVSGMLKIADFGLGKDLNVFTSHQTLYTNQVGQYFYCAPEQFMMLKDADKRSDVYSLGRIINFIMTGDSRNNHHIYGSVCSKAISSDAAYRYSDAEQLSVAFEKSVKYHQQSERKETIRKKILAHSFDTDVENYIYDMSSEEMSKAVREGLPAFIDAMVWFMGLSDENAEYVIQGIESTFRDVCERSFEANDPFAELAEKVIRGKFDFHIKETAATILRYVAWDVNRFSAQHKVERIIEAGVDPLIEEIIRQ